MAPPGALAPALEAVRCAH